MNSAYPGTVFDRIEMIAQHYDKSLRQLSLMLGLSSPQTFYDIKSGKVKTISSKILESIESKLPDVNTAWLQTGQGNMLNTNGEELLRNLPDGHIKIIPVLPFSAAAGYMSGDDGWDPFRGEAIAVKDFTDRGADCAIRVDGNSMYPRYNNGDMIAIKILKDVTFFQWGRVYVLSTNQGCVVKILLPDPKDPERILCRSINTEQYPDYTISMSDVYGVALVVGHTGVE